MSFEQISFGGMAGQWPIRDMIRTMHGGVLELVYRRVDTEATLFAMQHVLSQAEMIAYDTETSGLNPHLGSRVCGHAFACFTGPAQITAWYIPIRHVGGHNEAEPQLLVPLVSAVVQNALSFDAEYVFFHGKFDWGQALADGIQFVGKFEDVATLATAENENEPFFALKKLATKYCTKDAASEQTELDDWLRKDARDLKLPFKKRKKEKDGMLGEPTYMERFAYARAPIRLCGIYACKDVFYTLYLRAFTYRGTRDHWRPLVERENKVAKILHQMEWNGLKVDTPMIRDAYDRCHTEYLHWLNQARAITSKPNFAGTDAEVRELLFTEYKLKPPKQTKQKQDSVDREARGILGKRHPEHTQLFTVLDKLALAEKLDTTYTGNFLRYVSPSTGSIHASYNQLERRDRGGAPVTGRLSSADPNMQNIVSHPMELLDGSIVEIRRYFVVPEGYIRFYIDFSQIELRVLTWYCQDPVLLECYRLGLDVHQIIADQLEIPRKVAKQVNFGNSYGMTEIGLALRLPGYFDDPEGTREYAKQVLDAYFRRYRNIQLFKRAAADQMRSNRCLFVNPFGRPRRIPDLNAPLRWEVERAERKMMSSIVSGTAADLMKESMIRCDTVLESPEMPGAIVQTIHDELVFDVPLGSPWAKTLIKLVRTMEDWPMFSEPTDRTGVPIKVSADVSTTTWADKKPVIVHPDDTLSWAA